MVMGEDWCSERYGWRDTVRYGWIGTVRYGRAREAQLLAFQPRTRFRCIGTRYDHVLAVND